MSNGFELKGSKELIQVVDNNMVDYCVKLIQFTYNNVVQLRQEML